jgi:starch-binding outer membrane protein, SusD/RagB family
LRPVYTYDGEPNGDGFGAGTPTGYYGNKMCNDNVIPNYFFNQASRCLPLIRYADILLMYAEATNEYSGPSQEVYDAVEQIRQRAGLNPYQLKTGLTKDEMRTVIQHERRVELAFEESRFWDVRRWKIAEQTDAQTMTGMRVKKDANGDFTYIIETVRKRNFRKAMYLWPIPQSETAKSTDLLQNPDY